MDESFIRPRDVVKRDFVKERISRAEEDLGAAKTLARHGTAYLRQIGFHAQQAAEKFLKAFLTHHQVEFPKTHDLGELLSLAGGIDRDLASRLRDITELNPYAVDTRYPASAEPAGMPAAWRAIAQAENVRSELLSVLSEYQ